jgi:hypothetical protein
VLRIFAEPIPQIPLSKIVADSFGHVDQESPALAIYDLALLAHLIAVTYMSTEVKGRSRQFQALLRSNASQPEHIHAFIFGYLLNADDLLLGLSKLSHIGPQWLRAFCYTSAYCQKM